MAKQKRKYQSPLHIEGGCDDTLERLTGVDPNEVREEIDKDQRQKKGDLIEDLMLAFEGAAHHDDEGEYWLARELYLLLGYKSWQNIEPAIEKAKAACREVGEAVEDHFMDVHKMV